MKFINSKTELSKHCFEIHQKGYIEHVEAIKIDNPSQMSHVLIPHQTQQLNRVLITNFFPI